MPLRLPICRGLYERLRPAPEKRPKADNGQVEVQVDDLGRIVLCWLGEDSGEYAYLTLTPEQAADVAALMSLRIAEILRGRD